MEESNPFIIGFTGMMPFSLIIAAIIAYPLSLWLLKRYHTAVSVSMNKNATKGLVANTDLADRPIALADQKKENRHQGDNAQPVSASFFRRLLRRPVLEAYIHLSAGIVFAAVMSIVVLVADGTEILPFRFLFLFVIYLWPVIISIVIVAAVNRKDYFLIFGGYFLFYLMIIVTALIQIPSARLQDTLIPWCMQNLPGSILLLVFLNPKIRAVGPMVFIYLTFLAFGVFFFPTFLNQDSDFFKFIMEKFSDMGLSVNWILFIFCITGLLTFALAGWLALRLMRLRYRTKKISDQSIVLDAVLLIFLLSYTMLAVFSGLLQVFAMFVVFIFYKLIIMLADRQLKNRFFRNEGISLLFLRVFSLGKRSRDIFNRVSKYWRFAGSIQLISGPDLATTNIEPHEFLEYITGKLARRFITNMEQLHLRLSEMDNRPDGDGRYRVNDFFCYNDTWKIVLQNLISSSKVVLMDIRNFCIKNKGCEYEINELLAIIPLQKIVFVSDKTTDHDFLKASFQRIFMNLPDNSPNATKSQDDVCIFNFDETNNLKLKSLVKILSERV